MPETGSMKKPASLPRRRGLLAGLRIRKKLIVLHTVFSLGLLLLLIVGLRPAVTEVVDRAETGEALTLMQAIADASTGKSSVSVADAERLLGAVEGVTIAKGTSEEIGLESAIAQAAESAAPVPLTIPSGKGPPLVEDGGAAVLAVVAPGRPTSYVVISVVRREARDAVNRLFVLTVFALIGVYVFIAVTIELFVLPQAVYGPIETMLDADRALREGRINAELIAEAAIPSDELGEIMRSRNESVIALRTQEAQLARALSQLEEVANDLKRKNHLLETARRNLADADRLASLGMMSAGVAHELNTPLTVLKGLVERLNRDPGAGLDPASAALMLRVVERLERLGDSLLDFARARQPRTRRAFLREVVEEAITLVRLDAGVSGGVGSGGAERVRFENQIPAELAVECDADRMVQVFVNLVRNACNALTEHLSFGPGAPTITVLASTSRREGRDWVTVSVRDNGPGIDPSVLPKLFEPFASTRLDSRGTGLGLAVAEGIVREHGGVILARNLASSRENSAGGAEFEVMLPAGAQENSAVSSPVTE
jgi:signal transduction histidine kinase